MRIRNESGRSIVWRVFNEDDRMNLMAIREGTLGNGRNASFLDSTLRRVKVSIHESGSLRIQPTIFSMSSDLIYRNGSLAAGQIAAGNDIRQYLADQRLKCTRENGCFPAPTFANLRAEPGRGIINVLYGWHVGANHGNSASDVVSAIDAAAYLHDRHYWDNDPQTGQPAGESSNTVGLLCAVMRARIFGDNNALRAQDMIVQSAMQHLLMANPDLLAYLPSRYRFPNNQVSVPPRVQELILTTTRNDVRNIATVLARNIPTNTVAIPRRLAEILVELPQGTLPEFIGALL